MGGLDGVSKGFINIIIANISDFSGSVFVTLSGLSLWRTWLASAGE
jgi:hypothetical protein